MNVPSHDQIISFTVVPAGSYARVNEAYRVAISGKGRRATVWLHNVERGSSTFDVAAMYCRARWSEVAA